MEQIINRLLDKIEELEFEIRGLKIDINTLERQKENYELDVYLFRQFLKEQNIEVTRLDKYFLITREEKEEEDDERE